MRLLLFFLPMLFLCTASAQDTLANTHVCGRADVKVHIGLKSGQQAPTAPPPGQGLLYLLQQAEGLPHPLSPVFIGLDGMWVAAYKQNSWIALPVSPGEHAVCAFIRGTDVPEIQHLTVEAGKTYFLRTREVVSGYSQQLLLDSVSPEQARYMTSLYPTGTFTLTP